jgi:hypothetical protein
MFSEPALMVMSMSARRSSTATEAPPRRSSIASIKPTGPAPATTTSY